MLLAHGAGAGMDSPFMAAMADGLAQQGWQVLRFEFPYMQRQRSSGKKRPPDKTEVLLDSFRDQVGALAQDKPLVIGGKSMGGASPACWRMHSSTSSASRPASASVTPFIHWASPVGCAQSI